MNIKVTVIFISLLVTSCDKNLDIEPEQAISTNVALSNEQGVRTALIGTYDLLSQLPTPSGDIILNSEIFANSGDLIWTGFSIPLTQLINKNISPSNNAIENYWVNSYRTINQANTVLDAVEVVNDTDRNAIIAELRFLRAFIYFDLVNMFAHSWTSGNPDNNLGIPIITTPAEVSLENPEVPRNSVSEVYELIISDLLYAKTHLPSRNGVYANSFSASGILSRAYLMQEKFELAALEADRVIASGQYNLITDLEQIFNQSFNSSEDIFTLQVTTQDGQNRVSYFYSGEQEGGGAFIGIADEHLAKYENGDLRADLFYNDQLSNTKRSSKWKVNESNDGNVIVLRLAEMYLTRAEGRFRTGDKARALDDMNIIRNRANLPSITNTSLEMILDQRYFELVFEGHQFRDTKRNRKMFGDLPYDYFKMIYPIPQRELDVNKAMIQNEGY